MAETTLTPAQTLVDGGVVHTLAAANVDGSKFLNDGHVILIVKNADAGSHTVTVVDQGSVEPEGSTAFTPDVACPVSNGVTRILGPWPDKKRFNDADGYLHVTYDGVTSVTVQAVKTSQA